MREKEGIEYTCEIVKEQERTTPRSCARVHTRLERVSQIRVNVCVNIYISMCVRMYGWEEDAGSSLQYDRAKKRTNESESSAADD